MYKNTLKNKGFTLLVAIVTTSLLLIVSFMVANLAFKQLILSDAAEESQYAFYNADSGIECGTFWDLKHTGSATNPFNPSYPTNTVNCNNTGSPITPTRTQYTHMPSINAYVSTSTFTITLVKGCADVEVVKNQTTGITRVNSRGYNTCTAGALRKYQRGVSSTFSSNPAIPVNVTWADVTSASASGSNLTTSSASGWGTSGARSSQYIASGDGYAEYTVGLSSIGQMFGLTPDYGGNDFTNIDFAIHIGAGLPGPVNIYQNGNPTASNVSTYVAGDVFRVSVEAGTVKYYKNGGLIYTNSSPSLTYPLHVDVSFNTPNGSVTNAKIGS